MTQPLILKRARIGEWSEDDYDVLASGAVVGRIMKVHAAPEGSPWLWTLAFGHHEDRTPTHGLRADARGRDEFDFAECPLSGEPGPHLLAVSFSQFDPIRSSAALANGEQVVKSFRYLLTDPRQFDILQSDPGWQGTECNSIN
jgi:hypothetical protein